MKKLLIGFVLGFLTYFSMLELNDWIEYREHAIVTFGNSRNDFNTHREKSDIVNKNLSNNLLHRALVVVRYRPELGYSCLFTLNKGKQCPIEQLKFNVDNLRYTLTCF